MHAVVYQLDLSSSSNRIRDKSFYLYFVKMKADGKVFAAEIDGGTILISEISLHAIDGLQGHR